MDDDKQFHEMVRDFADGRTEVILMHIDTAKLLTRDEWELLNAAGASVVEVHKASSGIAN
ncbi:MAG: hypothetical protein KA105_00395 [Caulobacter sp.]|nr:hypothetical protein [Caulobacter sp.]